MTARGPCVGTARQICPCCGAGHRTWQTADTGRTQAWACQRCGTNWAVCLVGPGSRAAARLSEVGAVTQEIRWLRGTLYQLIVLADQAAGLSDHELRARLLALAGERAQ